MNNQYLVARYIQNIERGETRNIGIIFWTKGKVACRFLDSKRVDFSNSIEIYDRWINYWKKLCGQKRISLFGNKPSTLNSKRFLSQIRQTQDGNYRLDEGGVVIDDVNHDNIADATDFLFERIVATRKTPTEPSKPGIVQKCIEFFEASGIRDRVRANFTVPLVANDYQTKIHFDYGIGEDSYAESLFHRVNLGHEESVTSALGRFQPTIKLRLCKINSCFSLYDSDGYSDEEEFKNKVKFLSVSSTPIDVFDVEKAADFYQRLSLSS